MKNDEIIRALKSLKAQTGSLVCLGCGHEHNCGVHGCAVLRETVGLLEKQERQIQTLKAYEDTGLSPEKVSWMKEVVEAAFDNDTSRIERAHNLHVADKEGRELVVTCKVGPTEYKKNYVYLNDYTLYVVEDINGTHTDPYHYKVYFHTDVLPSVEVRP